MTQLEVGVNGSDSSAATASRNSRKKASTERSKNKRSTTNGIEEKPGDAQRLERILQNLNIRFTNCTFTYKTSYFAETNATNPPKRGGFFRRKITSTLERVREIVSDDLPSYQHCLFVPIEEQDDVKKYIQKSLSGSIISFENCKFIKRSSTLTEKVRRKLRTVFGIVFELEYLTAVVTVDQYKFRVKDIPSVNHYLQERIAEEG